MKDDPIIIINSIPKSGTHLLLQLILGYKNTSRYRWIYKEDDINGIKPGEVILAHLDFSRKAQKLMRNKNIKMIFVYRDLRDISVSLLHFIIRNQYNHPMNPYIMKTSPSNERRLLTIIKGERQVPFNRYSPFVVPPIDYYARKKSQWLTDRNVCNVSFEQLRKSERSLDKSLRRIIEYLHGHPYDDKSLPAILNRMKKNVNHAKSDTFRKGQIGDWKHEFKDIHKRTFKHVANDLLIKYGYESDDNW